MLLTNPDIDNEYLRLRYTLSSIQPIEKACFQKNIRKVEAIMKLKLALEKQQKYGL